MKPSRPPESLSQSDWQQTPPTVQAYLLNLHQRLVQLQEQIERLQNRLQRTAKTFDKPPSSDSPFQRHTGNPSKPTGKRGARQGHPGAGPKLHRPTERQAIYPEACICGQGVPRLTTPYHTHQVMELPSTLMHVTHWVLHQGKCAGCGKWLKARLPGVAPFQWTVYGLGVMQLPDRTSRSRSETGNPGLGDGGEDYTTPRYT